MTVAEARAQLELTLGYLHLEEDSFSIRNGRLQSKEGYMDIPVDKFIAIIPAHGTVMAIWSREERAPDPVSPPSPPNAARRRLWKAELKVMISYSNRISRNLII